MRLTIALAATLFASAAQAQVVPNRGPAQDAINNLLDPIRWADVSKIDVAGVRLGMTPADVRAALVAKGFTPQAKDPTMDSWAALIAKGAAERGRRIADQSTISMFTMASGAQGEHIEVWYAPTPEGARVASVKYSIPSNRMTDGAFASSLVAKYGKPSFKTAKKMVYCSRTSDSRSSCLQLGDSLDRPGLLAVAEFSSFDISLTEGPAAAKDRKARLAEAVEALAPKDAKASF